jgi:hypothetical protein
MSSLCPVSFRDWIPGISVAKLTIIVPTKIAGPLDTVATGFTVLLKFGCTVFVKQIHFSLYKKSLQQTKIILNKNFSFLKFKFLKFKFNIFKLLSFNLNV